MLFYVTAVLQHIHSKYDIFLLTVRLLLTLL